MRSAAGATGGSVQVVQSRPARLLGAAMVVIATVGLVVVALGGTESLLRWAAPVALFGVLGYAAFWRPQVVITDDGVEVVNTVRTVRVPWSELREVEGRYGLRLVTTLGAVQAWGAQAPVGRARGGAAESVASAAVRRRWEQQQARERYGHRVEATWTTDPARPMAVTYHLGAMTALVVLLTLSLARPLVG